MREVDLFPLICTHLLFYNICCCNYSLTIVSWRKNHLTTELIGNFTFSGCPFCGKTIALVDSICPNRKCLIFKNSTKEGSEVVPTTKLRNFLHHTTSFIDGDKRIRGKKVNGITESLAFTSAFTNIASPKKNTNCGIFVVTDRGRKV